MSYISSAACLLGYSFNLVRFSFDSLENSRVSKNKCYLLGYDKSFFVRVTIVSLELLRWKSTLQRCWRHEIYLNRLFQYEENLNKIICGGSNSNGGCDAVHQILQSHNEE